MYSDQNIGSDVAIPRPLQPMPQSTAATLMKMRGPMRSMSHPCTGWTHVWKRMKSVNASWMSDSFHPVPIWTGLTNSVHEYCRLAIITIAMTDATS